MPDKGSPPEPVTFLVFVTAILAAFYKLGNIRVRSRTVVWILAATAVTVTGLVVAAPCPGQHRTGQVITSQQEGAR